MIDAKKLLDDLLGSTAGGDKEGWRERARQAAQLARDNPIATGGLAALLLGTGSGRAVTGSALKLGGLAAIAGLAYKAYQDYQGERRSDPASGGNRGILVPDADSSFHPSQAPQGEEEFALVLVRAMVAAARSDGHVDETERRKIAERLHLSGIGAEEEGFLVGELERPIDIDDIVASARTQAQKVEIYTASRLAIDPQSRAEKGYLAMLAGRLNLPESLVDHVEATVRSVQE